MYTVKFYSPQEWPFGSAICKLTNYMQEVSVGVSVFTLSALSYDRYHATANPISHRKNYGKSRNCKKGFVGSVSHGTCLSYHLVFLGGHNELET